MKALVTGGAGFIGSHVSDFLIKKGHQVHIVDDLSGGTMENVPKHASFSKLSVNDNLAEIFEQFKPDIVYHLAAYAAEGLSHHIPHYNYINNVLGTVNVLTAAHKSGVKHFVFTSSIAAYGHPHGNELFNEDTRCEPCDPYGTAKLACEHHIKAFVDYFGGIKYTIFRPHNVFGSNQNIADPYRNVVGIFMARAISGTPMPVFGDGSQTRSFSYINVVSESIALSPFIPDAANEIFNIGGDEPLTVMELAAEVAKIFNVPLVLQNLQQRKEVEHAHCSHEKAKKVFKEVYENALDIRNGLRIMAESLKGKPIPSATECPSDIEIFDNLPKSWAERMLKNLKG